MPLKITSEHVVCRILSCYEKAIFYSLCSSFGPSSSFTETQGSDDLGFSEEVNDLIAPYNNYAYESPSRSSRSSWQLRAGKRAGMWKLRTGKRESDEAGKRAALWKLRTGKRTEQFLKRDRMWKLRTGKRASMWKLRTGKRSNEDDQQDDY